MEDRANVSEGTLKGMALFSNSWIYYSYDALSRLSKREVGGILEEHYTYLSGSGAGTTTTLPETYYTTPKGSGTKLSGYRYAYDSRNNIVQETDLNTGKYWKYADDGLGQLRYASDYASTGVAESRYEYVYDKAGNLTSRQVRNDDNTVIKEAHTYTYGDSEWKDQLTVFDGKSITYDANGNPTKYYNGATMTWRNGRQLASYSLGGKTYRYEYDVNGLRTKRSHADGGYTEYYIIDGLAVGEQRKNGDGTERYTLRYLYDESNRPVGFGMQYPGETTWINYYFEKNVQGDVIAVHNSIDGSLAARYSYDPYGNPTRITNGRGAEVSQTSNTIAAINPFRYRGYRYDGETGLYYLQSRYYDPVTCRFVNADGYASTGQGIVGHNMYAYCNNNPVNCSDPTGNRAMGPSFALVNDGAGGSVRFATGGDQEEDLLDYHADNAPYIDEMYNCDSLTATCFKTHNYTRTEEQNFWDAVWKGTAIGIVAMPISAVTAGLTVAGTLLVGASTSAVTSAAAYVIATDIPAGTYEQYIVMTTERYSVNPEDSNGGHMWRIVTHTTYYIDRVIGIGHEWRCVGVSGSERWVNIK